MRISPESAGCAPDRHLINVVLPAPLPPTRPTTSPGRRSTVTFWTAWTPPKATFMCCICTSRVLSATVKVVPPSRAARSAPVPRVEADGEDQDDARNDILAWRVDAVEAEAVRNRLHDEGADDRTRDRSGAARERRAADHGGRDYVQLVALADVEGRPIESGRRDGRRDGAQNPHHDVRLHDRPARIDTGQPGRIGVAAIGVDIPAETAALRPPAHHERHADK